VASDGARTEHARSRVRLHDTTANPGFPWEADPPTTVVSIALTGGYTSGVGGVCSRTAYIGPNRDSWGAHLDGRVVLGGDEAVGPRALARDVQIDGFTFLVTHGG
jgi:hypothetical protein